MGVCQAAGPYPMFLSSSRQSRQEAHSRRCQACVGEQEPGSAVRSANRGQVSGLSVSLASPGGHKRLFLGCFETSACPADSLLPVMQPLGSDDP